MSKITGFKLARLCWIATGCVATATHAPSIAADRPFTVCQVLANLDRYRGKFVTITGTLSGGYHGEFLQDQGGAKGCQQVTSQGHTWPPAVAITQYTSGADIEDGPATFESNTEQIRTALAGARERVKTDANLAVIVTVTGELRARKDIHVERTAEGWYYGTGYGQNGQYVALIVLKTVRDVKFAKRDVP